MERIAGWLEWYRWDVLEETVPEVGLEPRRMIVAAHQRVWAPGSFDWMAVVERRWLRVRPSPVAVDGLGDCHAAWRSL